MAGKAKAMVVCSSRPHAVRMWRQLTGYITDQGYDLGVLVAFSDEIESHRVQSQRFQRHPNGRKVRHRRLPDHGRGRKVPNVSTNPSSPPCTSTRPSPAWLRYRPFLDSTGSTPTGTFVLDFVNDPDQIRDSFATYHGMTVAPPTDPNLMFDTAKPSTSSTCSTLARLNERSRCFWATANTTRSAHSSPQSTDSSPSKKRPRCFRDALTRFVRTYGFLAQIVSFTNPGLERDYQYCRALASFIREGQIKIDLSSEVELTHLRHEMTFEGSISLPEGKGVVTTVSGGLGPAKTPSKNRCQKFCPHQRTIRSGLDRRRPTRLRSRRRRSRQRHRTAEPSDQQR